jgi:hypothetical protein
MKDHCYKIESICGEVSMKDLSYKREVSYGDVQSTQKPTQSEAFKALEAQSCKAELYGYKFSVESIVVFDIPGTPFCSPIT